MVHGSSSEAIIQGISAGAVAARRVGLSARCGDSAAAARAQKTNTTAAPAAYAGLAVRRVDGRLFFPLKATILRGIRQYYFGLNPTREPVVPSKESASAVSYVSSRPIRKDNFFGRADGVGVHFGLV